MSKLKSLSESLNQFDLNLKLDFVNISEKMAIGISGGEMTVNDACGNQLCENSMCYNANNTTCTNYFCNKQENNNTFCTDDFCNNS